MRPATAALAGAAVVAGAHAAPSVASLGQWLPVRAAPGDWCTWRGPRRDLVALTFDDGPDPATTGPILERLAELDVKATFFLLGPAAERHPDLLAAIEGDGHSIGVHGYDHAHHLLRTPGWIARDTARATEVVREVAEREVRWHRPPYGQAAAATFTSARRLGLHTVLWSAWGREWVASEPGPVVEQVGAGIEPGAIVLLHDSDATSPPGTARRVLDALEPIVTGLRRRGLTPVTLDELLVP